MGRYDFLRDLDFWDSHAADPFNAVRDGWTEEDFDTRTDQCLVTSFGGPYKDTDTFLDLGCGIGYACKMVAPLVKEYHGVDWSEGMLRVARERNLQYANAVFTQNDGETIPYPDDHFDHVITEQMFYHTPMLTSIGYIQELWRVLRPGGLALVEAPRAEFYVNGLTADLFDAMLPGCHHLVWESPITMSVSWRKP